MTTDVVPTLRSRAVIPGVNELQALVLVKCEMAVVRCVMYLTKLPTDQMTKVFEVSRISQLSFGHWVN